MPVHTTAAAANQTGSKAVANNLQTSGTVSNTALSLPAVPILRPAATKPPITTHDGKTGDGKTEGLLESEVRFVTASEDLSLIRQAIQIISRSIEIRQQEHTTIEAAIRQLRSKRKLKVEEANKAYQDALQKAKEMSDGKEKIAENARIEEELGQPLRQSKAEDERMTAEEEEKRFGHVKRIEQERLCLNSLIPEEAKLVRVGASRTMDQVPPPQQVAYKPSGKTLTIGKTSQPKN